jgi:hypothetical protein
VTLPVILRPAADADIQATHDELEQAQAGLGDRFVDRGGEILARIEAMPELFARVWQDVRAVRPDRGRAPDVIRFPGQKKERCRKHAAPNDYR